MQLSNEVKISVVLPCRNEEESVSQSIDSILNIFTKNNISGEIVVSDSSVDNSPNIAREKGVVLVEHNKDGYGNALMEGFSQAKGEYIFFADPDGTYDFNEIPNFLKTLEEGNDFVIGNRFKGKMDKNSMPTLHRYFGNPVLSFVFKLLFNSPAYDVHCGMRAIKSSKLKELNLQTVGMEFASEMVMKAIKQNFKIKELPINYHERKGFSKMRSFRDGWRHLRFMLLYSPMYLFFLPGVTIFIIGLAFLISFYFGAVNILGFEFIIHPMFVSSLLMIMGYQMIFFALFSKTYAFTHLKEKDTFLNKLFKYFNLEKGLVSGAVLIVVSLIIFLVILYRWINNDFGELNEIKNSLLATTLLAIGVQTVFASFMMSILGIKEK